MDYEQLLFEKKVIFFDGECNLCNFWINFFIRKDKKKSLFFASLQSSLGQYILQEKELDKTDFDSFIFYDNGIVYQQSTAAMKVFLNLPFPCKAVAYGIALFPSQLRDTVYRWIAKNRYRFFGKRESCRLPTEEEIGRFL
ncbi:MAG: thiol-disulfide oxidoreductase DCC family protein [Cyclobacteriaceae bacterium]